MNEPKKPAPTPEEYPLVITFLREDVQDLRQDMNDFRREVRQDINDFRKETRQELGELTRRFESRINWVITSLIGVGTLVVASAGVVVAVLRP